MFVTFYFDPEFVLNVLNECETSVLNVVKNSIKNPRPGDIFLVKTESNSPLFASDSISWHQTKTNFEVKIKSKKTNLIKNYYD